MKNKLTVLFLFSCVFFGGASVACTSSAILLNEPLYFYKNYLGVYTIYLNPTLAAIKSNNAAPGFPYYKKLWYGHCPKEFNYQSKRCVEYTVYPDSTNFLPDPMAEIEKYTHGKPNRGEVRVITNQVGTKYVYTIDHEKHFCGPYSLQ